MNSGQKGKAFERWDRDGVAQHRNLMHEIAMQKQISMYQREEKLLEKELREISKVKETLLQIRAPLRRRVRAAALEDNVVESSGVEKNLRKVSVATRKTSMAAPGDQQNCTIKHDSNDTSSIKPQTSSGRVSFQAKPDIISPSSKMRQRKTSVLETRAQQNTPQEMSVGARFAQRKISAPAFYAGKRPASDESGKTGFLPVIKTPNPPPECSPSVKRKSPLLDRPLSAKNDAQKLDDEVVYHTRSPVPLTPLAPSRVDVTMCRARSVPCELPSNPFTTRGRRAQSETDEVATLTMEETLRIKGKFRQIGHSVIATALLKGLKQKGQLSSEAIHNMHKPISLGDSNETKKEEDKDGEELASESKEDDQGTEAKQGQSRQTFRSVARKTINVNRMLSVRNNVRRRSQSDPSQSESSSSATAAYVRPKTVGNSTGKHSEKGLGQEKRDNSAQPRDFRAKGATNTEQRRNDSNTETQQDSNTQDESENENASQTQQMYRKQSTDIDPLRPLMNPRTAHARRRKNTLTGDIKDFIIGQVQCSAGNAELQRPQLDESTTGQKSVRFASDAWT